MAPVLARDPLHPYLSLHIIRERSFAVCTNDILCLIAIFFPIASAWTLPDLEFLFAFFEASGFPVCQAETVFVSLKILLIFSYTEKTLAFQLNFLTGLGLIFWFSKLVQAIYFQAI
jgi:hypothetical protein